MKKFLYFAALALVFSIAACKNNGYKVTGTVVGGADGDTVILANIKSMFEIDTLSRTVIKNNEFVFEGTQDTAAMRYIIWTSSQNPDQVLVAILALENADITVSMDKEVEVKGTPANDALTALNKKEVELNNSAEDFMEVLRDTTATPEAQAEANKQLEDFKKNLVTLYQNFVSENLDNVAGQTYLAEYASSFPDEFVHEQIDKLGGNIISSDLKSLIELYEVKEATAVGQPFKDITAATPEGNDLSVSAIAKDAKVLMIDFWASWCGPCRAEMPNVKACYEQYHAQGFDIIGVSLDNDAEAWKQAIASLEMPWPQISDLKGWESEGAALYGVRAIPATVLIKDGKIVARDVRGEELAVKVGELLK